jgi:acid stress-induced BolA-like protein IbaG/YrbA
MRAVNDLIVQTIRRALPDAQVFVDSPDGQHFQAVVVSSAFEGRPLVQQHQLVMKALAAEFDSNRVHAMQLKTLTPAQYDAARQRAGARSATPEL